MHDLVWISLIVTGEVLDYDYAALESCIAAQYQYGGGGNPMDTAVALLQSIVKTRPFPYGNRRCAFLTFLVYLNLNGYDTKVSDMEAAILYQDYLKGDISAEDVVERFISPNPTPNMASIPLRDIISRVCNEYGEELKYLSADDGPKELSVNQIRG